MTLNAHQDSTDHLQLLIATIRNTTGTVNFQGVANDLGLTSAGAAQKRVKRLLEKHQAGSHLSGTTLGTIASSSGDTNTAPTAVKPPRTSRAKNASNVAGTSEVSGKVRVLGMKRKNSDSSGNASDECSPKGAGSTVGKKRKTEQDC